MTFAFMVFAMYGFYIYGIYIVLYLHLWYLQCMAFVFMVFAMHGFCIYGIYNACYLYLWFMNYDIIILGFLFTILCYGFIAVSVCFIGMLRQIPIPEGHCRNYGFPVG